MTKKARTKRHTGWARLDNAAKIFPPTSDKRDPKVFRFACELTENVKPTQLQAALDQTLQSFHGYLSVLRHGFFWYFLESTDLRPKVHIDNRQICYPLYDRNEQSLLFDVSYYKRRINLEIYHALADGTGALAFLRELVCCYLSLVHPELTPDKLPNSGIDASPSERMADSFQKYYDATAKKISSMRRAHKVRGPRLPENQVKVIEGILPVDKVRALAKEHHTTITVLLSALLIRSILDGMSIHERKRPVTLAIPVNLRNYFPSESVRNFFGVVYVSYRQESSPVTQESDPATQDSSPAAQDSGPALLTDIIASVAAQFKENLTKERMQGIMNSFISVEKNLLVRAVPLIIKDCALKLAYLQTESAVTAAFSNIGRVTMPPEYDKYIRLFDVMTSTRKLQICMCSYQNNLVVNFTDFLVSADIQKYFFRTLAGMGIPVTLVTSPLDEEAATHETL